MVWRGMRAYTRKIPFTLGAREMCSYYRNRMRISIFWKMGPLTRVPQQIEDQSLELRKRCSHFQLFVRPSFFTHNGKSHTVSQHGSSFSRKRVESNWKLADYWRLTLPEYHIVRSAIGNRPRQRHKHMIRRRDHKSYTPLTQKPNRFVANTSTYMVKSTPLQTIQNCERSALRPLE